MLIWVFLAIAVVSGVAPAMVGAGALVAVQPILGVGALGAVALSQRHRGRERDGRDEVGFLRYLATSVSAGMSLRFAIRSGDPVIVSRRTKLLCDAGRPIDAIGQSMASNLPTNGRTFSAVCAIAEQAGSQLAPTLHSLADLAEAGAAQKRKQRVATTQARFSAGVVGVVPLVVTGLVLFLRGWPDAGNPWVVIPIVTGVALQVLGLVIVYVFAGRNRP
ncbi:MAG: type II secretion system F family protein [Acidimicrobiia bacterium]